MDFAQIRRLVIIAMFSDDVLLETLVLKGGNALTLVHEIGERASMDVDFSMEDDFEDLDDVTARIRRALEDRFDAAGHVVFDVSMVKRPSADKNGARWGGYRVEFKAIDRALHAKHKGDLEKIRREALPVGPDQSRKFGIDISKYEFCDGKERAELDAFTIYVYSRPMIAAEKLRALCQQMPEYGPKTTKTPRAADFYDVHELVTRGGVDLTTADSHRLITDIFGAKDVPLTLLGRIRDQREFHRPDWPSVEQTVASGLRDYDTYFNFVVAEVEKLKALWME
jgi:hypothetical protein